MNPKSIPKRLSWVLPCVASFFLSVAAFGQKDYTVNGPFLIDNTVASPSNPLKSTNKISGAVGVVEKVVVTLNGLTHTYPDDLDILLVGPNGVGVILTSDAGGQGDVSAVNLAFDSSGAATAIADEAQIVSGTYTPFDYAPADSFSGVTFTPQGSLNAFANIDPNGDWRLIVVDDESEDNGSLASWKLTLYTTPTISIAPTSGTTEEDKSINFTVTVNDTDTSLSSLNLSADIDINYIASVNYTPTANPNVWTLTLTPKANVNGSTAFRATVSDGTATTKTALIPLTITPINDAPTIDGIQAVSTTIARAGVSTNINIKIGDVDTDTNTLVLNASSDNPAVVSSANVYFSGTGTNRSVRVASTGLLPGVANLTITATDGSGTSASRSLQVTVTQVSQIVAAKTNAIVVADGNQVVSTNTISGAKGLIGELEVVLLDLEHATPSDLSVLLVGPAGQKVVLMRGAGDGNAITNRWLKFDDDAGTSLTAALIDISTNKPTDLGAGNVGSGDAAGPYATTLSAFEGTNPNGDWRLFVVDAAGNAGAQINGGWILVIYQAPTIEPIANQVMNEGSVASAQRFIPVTSGSTNRVSVTLNFADQDGSVTNIAASIVSPQPSTNTPTAIVTVETSALTIPAGAVGAAQSATITIATIGDLSGTNQIQVIAKDNTGEFTVTNYFNVVVTPINDAPTQEVIPKQLTRSGEPIGPIIFTVGDKADETAAANLVVNVTTDNAALLPTGSIILTNVSATQRGILLFPAATKALATANITVTVTDAGNPSPVLSSQQTFQLTVEPAANFLETQLAAIDIRDNASAVPYPSSIYVTNVLGQIAEVKVTLYGLTHPNPDDLDILLVGPMGTNVVLMSDVGDDQSLTNAIIQFSALATNALPDEGRIYSGVYDVMDAEGTADFPFESSPTWNATSLNAYTNAVDAQGFWRLFIRDSAASAKGGALASWQLSIRTRPQLALITNQITDEDIVKTFRVSVGTPQPGVQYTYTSSSTIPAGQQDVVKTIAFTPPTPGSDSLTVTITPEDNAFGTNVVTINVTDPDGFVSSRTFDFIVLSKPDAPTITGLPTSTNTPAGTPISVTFTVSDAPSESTVDQIATTVAVEPASMIAEAVFTDNSGADRTLRIVPAGFADGAVTVTVTATDSDNTKSSRAFTLNITKSVGGIASGAITINHFEDATPYPSTINVSGVKGRVSGVRVVLNGFRHTFPDDVDILLVPPGVTDSSTVRPVLLMSDAGGNVGVSGLRLTFATGGSALPNDGPLVDDATYAPENFADTLGGTDIFRSPAPQGSYGTSLSALAGIDPNGEWKLFVRDDTTAESGAIEGGWILILETGPTFTSVPTTFEMSEDTGALIPFTVADEDSQANQLSVTYTILDTQAQDARLNSSSEGLLTGTGATNGLTTNGFNYTLGVRATTNRPIVNASETNIIRITVTDEKNASATTNFVLKVNRVNDDPTVSLVTNTVTINEDGSTVVIFTIRDVDSTLRTNEVDVTVAPGFSGGPIIIPDDPANIRILSGQTATFGPGVAGAVEVTLAPPANNNGTNILTFSVKDRDGSATITTNLTFIVNAVNDNPTISDIGNVGIQVGQSTTVNFTVGDMPDETRARDLVVTYTSSQPTVIPVGNISQGGNDRNRSLTLTALNQVGSSLITVRVTDANGAFSEDTFTVTVSPSPERTFANPNAITIRDLNTATPYPSTIDMGTVTGVVHSITITLEGFTHSAPDDVDILLVNRNTGTNVVLMSDAGGSNSVSGVRLTFSATATTPLPDDSPLSTGIYAGSNYRGIEGDTDSFPAGAPASGRSNRLADFLNAAATGPWDLYVVDDRGNDAGVIQNGWSISIVTRPTIEPVGLNTLAAEGHRYQQWNEDEATTLTFAINDPILGEVNPGALEIAFAPQNTTLLPVENIRLDRSGGNTITATFRYATNAFGTNKLTVTVTRPSDRVSQSVTVPLNVLPVNDTLIVTGPASGSTQEDKPVSFNISVTDPDVETARSALWLEVQSDQQGLIQSTGTPITNITINGVQTNLLKGLPANPITVTLSPKTNANGPVNITLIATEAGANPVQTSFLLTVSAVNDLPIITVPAHQDAVEAGGSTTNIAFTVSDVESSTLTVTPETSDTNVVELSGIVIDPVTAAQAARTVRITSRPTAGASQATIRLIVSDADGGKATNEFVLKTTLPREQLFTNSTAITIRDNNTASPYPSPIAISGFIGNISKITATLNGFQHSFPADVDVLLVHNESGKKVLLMSDAGSGNAVTGLSLRFDQTEANAIPLAGPLASGRYKPANYNDGTADVFAAPAPAAPYAETLDAFKGVSPNGTWSLYVVDDTTSDSGQIANGWTLGITTEPFVTLSTNLLNINEDQATSFEVTVQDEAPPIGNANPTVTATALDTSLVTGSGLSVSKTSATTWTVNVTPVANAWGTNANAIAVNVSYAPNQSVTRNVGLSIAPRNDAPTITSGFTNIVPSGVDYSLTTEPVVIGGETVSLQVVRLPAGGLARLQGLNYVDVETDKASLVLTNEVGSPSVFPRENVIITGNDVRIFTQGAAFGTNLVTLIVRDPQGAEARLNILVEVKAPQNPLFANTGGSLTIPSTGPASVYPSTTVVSGLGTNTTRVTVTLTDVNHPFPDDLDILLVGPQGQRVVLMSDAGGSGPLVNARLNFEDAAANSLPDNSQIDEFGSYKPTNFDSNTTDAHPGTNPSGNTALSLFNGTNPNGTWSLYVMDDQSPDGGKIGGWLLSIQTTLPTISQIPNQFLNEDTPKLVSFRVEAGNTPGASLGVGASVGGDQITTVSVGAGATQNERTLTITPRANLSGTDVITLYVTNGTEVASTTFTATVAPVNDAPLISGLSNTNTAANRDLNVLFVVLDIENQPITVTATSSNPAVGSATVTGEGGTRTLVFTPNRDWTQDVSTTVSVVATDGTDSTTNTLVIAVTAPLAPSVIGLNDTTGFEDTTVRIPFIVNSANLASVTIAASAANSDLVSKIVAEGEAGFPNRELVITLQPNAFGVSTNTVIVTDEFASVTNVFVLTIPNLPDPPTLGAIADITVDEDVSPEIALVISDPDTALADLQLSSSISNPALVSSISYTVTESNILARINVVPEANGFAALSISVSDGQSSPATRAFGLTVRAVNDEPTLAPIENLVVLEDSAITVPLTVTDKDTPLNGLVFSSATSDTNLIRKITFNITEGGATAVIDLVTNAFGTNLVTISVSEGETKVSQSFGLRVQEVVEPPVLGPISDIVTNENTVITVPLSVADPDNSLQELSFFSSVEGTALVSDIQFSFGEAGAVAAVITLKPNAAGTETVTISVSDGNDVVRQSFNLTVNAVNDRPVIGAIDDQTVTGGATAQVTFTVTDPDTQIGDLAFIGSTGGAGIVTGIAFEVAGPSSVRATLTLAAGKSGTERVTFSVSDGENTALTSFNLTVNAQVDPASLRIAKGAGTSLTITATGTANATYVIEGTSNFNTWTQAGTITTDANGTGTLTIQNTGSYQFFRARNQ